MNCPSAAALTTALFLLCAGCGGEKPDYEWDLDVNGVSLSRGGATIWKLNTGDVSKPFFDLALTDGTPLTWNAPPDHPWHHAHWFTWKFVNGLNYWEEDRDTGISEGRITWKDVSANHGSGAASRIQMVLEYHPPDEPAVLREETEIVVAEPDSGGSYHLDWTMSFTALEDVFLDRTPIAGEENGKPWGGYAGLSIRFAEGLKEWKAVSSEGPVTWDEPVPFHAVRGPSGLDFSGIVNGREAGIAILDHPENLNAPTPWYIVMNQEKSFAFSEAALLYYDPVQFQAGQQFQLRYRVVVHEGRWDADAVKRRQAEFVKEVDAR